MWFLSRFKLNLLKSHVPFENSAREGGFLKSLSQITIWLFKADFQKERGFWVNSGLISSKTTFLLRILLMKVVFSNHFLKYHFQIFTFQSRFPKRMWFWSRFRLNLLKNHVRILLVKVVFSNHFLKSPFSNLTFQSRFPQKQSLFPKETSIKLRFWSRNFLTLHFWMWHYISECNTLDFWV